MSALTNIIGISDRPSHFPNTSFAEKDLQAIDAALIAMQAFAAKAYFAGPDQSRILSMKTLTASLNEKMNALPIKSIAYRKKDPKELERIAARAAQIAEAELIPITDALRNYLDRRAIISLADAQSFTNALLAQIPEWKSLKSELRPYLYEASFHQLTYLGGIYAGIQHLQEKIKQEQ